MGKPKNASVTTTVTLSLSEQSVLLLRQLALRGIYGKNEADVATRLVDTALKEYVKPPLFTLPLRKGNKRSMPRLEQELLQAKAKRTVKKA